MRKFFRLLDDVNILDRWHLGEIYAGGSSIEFQSGSSINSEKILRAIIDRRGRPLDFSLTSFAWPVARIRLADAIASVAGLDLQCLFVEINGFKEFKVMNALRVVACLDENESIFTKWTKNDHRPELAGQYRMVAKLRLDSGRIPHDANFFRVEGWCVSLIVSQAVKDAMENSGCFGAIFHDVT